MRDGSGNGNGRVFTVWSESIPIWETGSNTAILELRARDQVWLRTRGNFTSHMHGNMYSTFSGHILFEDSLSASRSAQDPLAANEPD